MSSAGWPIGCCLAVLSMVVVLLPQAGASTTAAAATSKASCRAGACLADPANAAPGKEHLLLQQTWISDWWKNRASRNETADQSPPEDQDEVREEDACSRGVLSRRRRLAQCACRRRHSSRRDWWGRSQPGLAPLEDLGRDWRCEGFSMKKRQSPAGTCEACLCVFDIDRTLTGKQEQTEQCPRNRVVDPPVEDLGYGSGKATLSALAAQGINSTFCNQCYLGITSAGHGSGEDSPWNAYILEHVMRGQVHDSYFETHSEHKVWSKGTWVRSPFVLGQGNKIKQDSVELIRQWYAEPGRDICIRPSSVYFFGDRTENIEPFREYGLNSREISCGSRDPELYRGSGLVGYCGARPEEIMKEAGNLLCT